MALVPAALPLWYTVDREVVYDLGPAWYVTLVFVAIPLGAALALGVGAGKLAERWSGGRARRFG